MRGYAALDSDRPLQDDRSLVLSAVDSTGKRIARSKYVPVPSNDKWLSWWHVTERAIERNSGTRIHLSPIYICICICVCAQCKRKFVCSLPNWWCYTVTFESVWSDNFFCCQRSNTLEHYVADTLPPQCLFVTLDEAICCYTRWLWWDGLSSVTPVMRPRCGGNWGWNCTFWTDSVG